MDPVIDLTLRVALALLFLAAAAHKLRDPGHFRAMVSDYRLLPARVVPPAATLLAGAEVAVAGALLAPPWRTAGQLGGAGLLLLYGGAIAINLGRGRRHIDCGCAGPAARRPISEWLVARNAVLAALALVGLLPVRSRGLVWVDGVTVVAATAFLAAAYASVERMIGHAPDIARLRGGA
jgi:hypothetical protein